MTDILLVDDDVQLVKSLAMSLNADGYEVSAYCSAHDALKGLEQQQPNIAVLDITMPEMNGIDLMEKIREQLEIPVIFLTGRDDEMDQVLALRLGADDYVCKPCSARLVSERIRTVLRRSGRTAQEKPTETPPLIRGDLSMDDMRHAVTWKGQNVVLTASEYLLMRALAQYPGHINTRNALMDILAPPNDTLRPMSMNAPADDRIIDTHIKRLRKKFRAVDAEFSAIKTIYGVGYKFVADEKVPLS